MEPKRQRRSRWRGRPQAVGKKKAPSKRSSATAAKAKAKPAKKKTTKKPTGKKAAKAKAPAERVMTKREAREKRRAIMRQDVRSFVGSRRKELEDREREEQERRRSRFGFATIFEDINRRKREAMEVQREQRRRMGWTGPGRMGELGGTVTRAFSIPADLDEDLEELREELGMGRSEFYETVFEYFLRVYEE